MAAPLPPVFTVQQAMIQCGVPDAPLFDRDTPSARMASQIFLDSFETTLSITTSEVNDAMTSFTKLAVANGRIPLQPGVKRRVLAFVQWARSMLRTGRDPTLVAFPVGQIISLTKDLQTCNRFEQQAEILATQAKPKSFKPDTEWADWEPTLVKYLRLIPGTTGVPLSYIVRRSATPPDAPIVGPVLDSYVTHAPLIGDAYEADTQSVHTLILSFITEYPEVESIVRTATEDDGREAYMAMVARFEGVGALSTELLGAEQVIKSMFYGGEKPPTMYWQKFEKDLKYAYAVVDRRARRVVHDDEAKLRSLINERIKADFLKTMNSILKMQLGSVPLTLTFQGALDALRNEVNAHNRDSGISKFKAARQQRNISSTDVRGKTKRRTDSTWEKLTNGETIEYHPSFRFGNKLQYFPKALREKLDRQRSDYKKKKNKNIPRGDSKRSIKKVKKDVGKLGELVGLMEQSRGSNSLNVSETNANVMGGRNSRQSRRETEGSTNDSISGDSIKTRISQLKNELNISTLNVKIKKSVTSNKEVSELPPGTVGMNEADTNAECGVAGKNMIPLSFTTRSADVFGFLESKGAVKDVPVITAATAYTCPSTGITYILLFHEFLWFGDRMDHSLINPNQLRHFGLGFWDNPYDKERGLKIDVDDNLTIPLSSQGTKLVFESRVPTRYELNTCEHIDMCSKDPWDPRAVVLQPITQRPPDMIKLEDDTYAYLDATDEESIIHAMGGLTLGMKNNLISKVSISSTMYDSQAGNNKPDRRTLISGERHSRVSEDTLANKFGISGKKARETLKVTHHNGTRSALLPLSRRYKADRRYQLPRLNSKFATDTFYAKKRSLLGNTCSQLYSTKGGFNAPYHMSSANGTQVGQSLNDFIHEWGIPEHLTFDGAMVQTGRHTDFMKIVRKHNIDWHVSQPRVPKENPAEGSVREVKRRYYRMKEKSGAHDRAWDFLTSYVCETGNVTSNDSRYTKGRTPIEGITGNTPDISEYMDFSFWDLVTYKSDPGVHSAEIGRWMGVSHRVGPEMAYWILPASGRPISCTTVQRITNLEKEESTWKKRIEEYETKVNEKLNAVSSNINISHDLIQQGKLLSLDDEDEDFIASYNRVIDSKDVKHIDDLRIGEDNFIGMELGIRRGDDARLDRGVVKRRALDDDGTPMGTHNPNILIDNSIYEVEFANGDVDLLAANVIAENLLAQIDDQGHRHLMLGEILDHRVLEDAIPISRGTYKTKHGTTRRIQTTRGWEIYVEWRDGSTDWIALKDVKDSYPVQLAEYAVANGLQDEPVFAWWVPFTIKKRDRIIKKIKSKYWSRTHKYGIRVPKSIKEAIEIDKENGNTLWMDAVKLEMKNILVAFDPIEDPSVLGKEFSEITGHLVFDIKLGEGFRRKARWVANGHLTEPPSTVTYSTVVARDSVRIMLLIASLNELEVQGADIQNAYLNAPNKEKHWMRAGPEFGELEGKFFIVSKALYGLKSAGASFRSFLAKKIDSMGFASCVADPDVWRRPASKEDGETYYEYVMTYVDDIIAISVDAKAILNELKSDDIRYKNDKIEPPESYLGAKLNVKVMDGVPRWVISSDKYVEAAVRNVEQAVKNSQKYRWERNKQTPMVGSYSPELDGTPELDSDELTTFQELIGVLRWATEIGRVDILHEVAILSQYQASAREGHLQQVYNIFSYLKHNPKLSIHMDPQLPEIDYTVFDIEREGFYELYRDAEEQIPSDKPKSRGRRVVTTAYVDASHGANKMTRRSHTGFVIFINKAPIHWFSKRQPTVESSAFSAEFIAIRSCIEEVRALRYKLRMFGVPIDGPTHIFCDNKSVVNNCSKVESLLNKKHSSVAYHMARWAVAAGEVCIGWISGKYNLSDVLTKRLTKERRQELFWNWTY